MSQRVIVEFAETVAGEMQRTYSGAPFDELRAWVRIAHEREAMVTKLYELSQIETRLATANASDEGEAGAVVRAAVASIWAHEESHTRFLGTLRGLSESFAGIAELQGRLEGWVTRSAISGGILARALIAVGASIGAVPEFAAELRRLDLRGLLGFHEDLETTARMGYRRILDLARQLDVHGKARLQDVLGLTFDLDIAKILCEECFHEDAFREMGEWLAPDGTSFVPTSRLECVRILRDLGERNLSMDTVRRTLSPTPSVPKGEPLHEGWASDGGLGELFAGSGMPAPVLSPGTVRALVWQ